MVSTPSTQRVRIVVGRPGPDDREYDATMVARALRDAGHEVIYAGLHQTPEQIVATAIQEDADLIGVATVGGAEPALAAELSVLLAERDASDIAVVAGSAAEIRRWVAENFAG
jgi:methylmalonyl-CoA mutase C-terminal domain/subunit